MIIDTATPNNRVKAFWFVWPDALHYRGSIIRLSFPAVLMMTGYGVGIAFLIRQYEYMAIQLTIMTPVAVVLSLLLVFRTNSAYDRYWEGRKIWQDLKVTSRNMIRNVWCGMQEKSAEDSARKRQALKEVAALVISIKHYIRGEDGLEYADYDGLLTPEFRMRVMTQGSNYTYGAIGDSVGHNSPQVGGSSTEICIQQQQGNEGWERTTDIPLPSKIMYEIQKSVEYMQKNGLVPAQLYVNMLNLVNGLGGLIGGCERIISTPIPLAYHIHLHHSLYLYLMVLPWSTGSMGLAKCIILQAIISFMMIGIDAISREIQNPFGYDANDLPLDAFCESLLVELSYALTHRTPTLPENIEDTLSENSKAVKEAAMNKDCSGATTAPCGGS
ncbi:hypothetical protein H4S08_001777 [Coemansia sp. RSA 1365]|nr:hypothetical protein H4S08_001777 [Coemansia sp. RSA 1365]